MYQQYLFITVWCEFFPPCSSPSQALMSVECIFVDARWTGRVEKPDYPFNMSLGKGQSDLQHVDANGMQSCSSRTNPLTWLASTKLPLHTKKVHYQLMTVCFTTSNNSWHMRRVYGLGTMSGNWRICPWALLDLTLHPPSPLKLTLAISRALVEKTSNFERNFWHLKITAIATKWH